MRSSDFYWASFEMAYPYLTKISMSVADYIVERTQRRKTSEWYGHAIDDQAMIDLVQKHQKPLYVFYSRYDDALEMMVVELQETFEVPRQTELL